MRCDKRYTVAEVMLLGLVLVWSSSGDVRAGADGSQRVTISARVLDLPEVLDDGSFRFHVAVDSDQQVPRPAVPTAGGAAAPLFADGFDDPRRPRWRDVAGTTTIVEGKLAAASERNLIIASGVREQNVRVSVDADATVQMGILVRYQDAENYVLAFYTPGARILGFHQVVGGKLGPWIQPVSTALFSGKSLQMTVDIQGRRIAALLRDENGQMVRTRAVLTRLDQPGEVGLYHDTSVPGTQQFDNFRAVSLAPSLPDDAIQVLVPGAAGDESTVWAINRRVRISGVQSASSVDGRPRQTIRVDSVQDIVPIVEHAADRTLFPARAPGNQFLCFPAAGLVDKPACGVIYRTTDLVTNGMPLGGVDTGCIDLETSGMLGYATIFNTHVPRRGPLNVPLLGLSVAGETWVLCDPQPKDGWGEYQQSASGRRYRLSRGGQWVESTEPITPIPTQVRLDGVRTVDEIHYWGHYPVADLEFETSAPVAVGMRAWSPFLPGDVTGSMLPGAVFEVHLRNPGRAQQSGAIAISFPGPLDKEAGPKPWSRQAVEGAVSGVEVGSRQASYVLGVIGDKSIRLGGELADNGAAWGRIHEQLPPVEPDALGASVAVDFSLPPGESQVVRFLVAWHSPDWNAGGYSWAGAPHHFTHMYARHYPSARAAAETLARKHQELLRRILAWQQVVYAESTLPVWLRESLVNVLHLVTETGLWAQAKPPLPEWVRPEDGLFGMNECPRGCPQIECIPCSFYGNQPLVYFFPQLALSTLRGYKGYQYPDGAAVWVSGGCTGGTPPIDFANPTRGYQFATNGISLAAMVDRYLLCYGENDKGIVEEFFPTIKQNMIYTVNLRPEYSLGDRIIAMPTGNVGTEWFEAPEPGWRGMTAHVGGLHLAQLRIAERMARLAGDDKFARQCAEWIDAGAKSMNEKLWTGDYYLNYLEPETNSRSNLIFGYQLDGQWITDHHGLPGALPAERVKTTLATIRRGNVAATRYGAVNYVSAEGKPVAVGGYGTYSYFPPEALMLAMTYMYAGQKEFGLELARKVWHNIECIQGYTWDMPNIMRGDVDSGERTFGNDYYQDMMLWSLPAAIEGKDFGAPARPGGLVDRIRRAAGESHN